MSVVRPAPGSWRQDALFVDGRWRTSATAERIAVRDCATEVEIGSVVASTPVDVDAAVAAARRAQPQWARLTPAERAASLRAWHAALAARVAELTSLISAEVGTAVRLCGPVQVESALGLLRTTADLLMELPFEERAGASIVLREPAGVVAAVTPWNYPLFQALGKIAGALAAGCTVVHKPSALAPLSAVVLAQAAEAAGLPPGVYDLVTGSGAAVGEALAAHPEVDAVSFTGSTATGVRVYGLAAATVKRVTLELGGKSASVLLDDAPLEAAVRTSVNRAFLNSGQTCDAWTRLVVPRDRLGDVLDLAVQSADRLTLGDPFDERTRLGPLVSAEQAARVRGYIEGARAAGAAVVSGGSERPAGLERGNYVKPTVLSKVTPDMAVAREEVFGPVLAVMAYDDEAEASAIVEATEYGLSGAVWSADPERAVRFARGMRVGQVVINGGRFDPLVPFGGRKRSGLGRELGRAGIEEFLESKALVF